MYFSWLGRFRNAEAGSSILPTSILESTAYGRSSDLPFLFCDRFVTGISEIDQSFDRAVCPFIGRVSVPSAHLDRRVTEDRGDSESISAAISEPGRRRVTQLSPSDFGVFSIVLNRVILRPGEETWVALWNLNLLAYNSTSRH